jgi:hypothetical protein
VSQQDETNAQAQILANIMRGIIARKEIQKLR